jgi:heterotetrameric sarcosine oxidase delta subunit
MSICLHCPNCGRRPIAEFHYGDMASVPETIVGTEARDLDRAFMQSNTEGITSERWFHAFGCRRWVTVERDTRKDDNV